MLIESRVTMIIRGWEEVETEEEKEEEEEEEEEGNRQKWLADLLLVDFRLT